MMQRILLIAFVVLLGGTQVFGQTVDTTKKPVQDVTSKFSDDTYAPYIQQYNNRISADSKKNFWYFVSEVGSVLDNTANGVSANPRLDQLGLPKTELFKKLQFNGTLVTKTNSLFKPDSLGFGFTYAAINNFTERKWKEEVESNKKINHYRTVVAILDNSHIPIGTFADPAKARQVLINNYYLITDVYKLTSKGNVPMEEIALLPVEVKYMILQQLQNKSMIAQAATKDAKVKPLLNGTQTAYSLPAVIPDEVDAKTLAALNAAVADELSSASEDLQDVTATFLSKKPQLNLTASGMQNFITDRVQGWYIGFNYTGYFGSHRRWSWTGKATYSWEADTLKKTWNFNRDLLKPSGTLDWLTPLGNKDTTKVAPLELKLSVEADWVTSGNVYVDPKKGKEKLVTPIASLGITFNATDKVSFPFVIKYVGNPKQANLFGFLSVQYALGSTKPSQ